ncbi:MAG: hypothetical protein FJ029_01210, partial [Actinobacteria bacterium]|nr:hypothetical protein [Actinomycetota bacterium]
MQVGNAEALKQMIRGGVGIGVAYAHVVEWEYLASQLLRLTVTDLGGNRPLQALTQSGGTPTPAAGTFAQLAREAFAELGNPAARVTALSARKRVPRLIPSSQVRRRPSPSSTAAPPCPSLRPRVLPRRPFRAPESSSRRRRRSDPRS